MNTAWLYIGCILLVTSHSTLASFLNTRRGLLDIKSFNEPNTKHLKGVALLTKVSNSPFSVTSYCSGTLIKLPQSFGATLEEDIVLTAAHCLWDIDKKKPVNPMDEMRVEFGVTNNELYATQCTKDTERPIICTVKDWIVPSLWKTSWNQAIANQWDIGVMFLKCDTKPTEKLEIGIFEKKTDYYIIRAGYRGTRQLQIHRHDRHTTRSDTIDFKKRFNGDLKGILITSGDAASGDSGGPMIDQHNIVRAVLSARHRTSIDGEHINRKTSVKLKPLKFTAIMEMIIRDSCSFVASYTSHELCWGQCVTADIHPMIAVIPLKQCPDDRKVVDKRIHSACDLGQVKYLCVPKTLFLDPETQTFDTSHISHMLRLKSVSHKYTDIEKERSVPAFLRSVALLTHVQDGNTASICSGVLIKSGYILTAASCVYRRKRKEFVALNDIRVEFNPKQYYNDECPTDTVVCTIKSAPKLDPLYTAARSDMKAFESDFAVIEIECPSKEEALHPFAIKVLHESDHMELTFAGYPVNRALKIDKKMYHKTDIGVVLKSLVLKVRAGEINSGKGGPMYDDEHYVRAIYIGKDSNGKNQYLKFTPEIFKTIQLMMN